MTTARYEVRAIGRVESPLTEGDRAPRQGDEGAPDAWLVLDAGLVEGLAGLAVADFVIVLTWLDRARRDVLAVHPRGEVERRQQGVFATRSPDRPNPIGLHTVEILAIEHTRILVRGIEAFNNTPVLDIKPILGPIDKR